MIDTAKVLDACPPLKGPNIAVLSGQAGPGMIAADAVEKAGLKLARFSAKTQDTINSLLPPIAIRTNPVDMGPTWYNAGNILAILKAVLEDEGTDGVIFIFEYRFENSEDIAHIIPGRALVDWIGANGDGGSRLLIVSCVFAEKRASLSPSLLDGIGGDHPGTCLGEKHRQCWAL